MADGQYIQSVDELIALHLTIDASIQFARVTTGKAGRDDRFESVVYRTILAALRQARDHFAVPRTGTMTFDEAMQAVAAGKMVTRPGWPILHVLLNWDDGIVNYWELDNLDGSSSGSGRPYDPTEEERAATDWMEYQQPEMDLIVDFSG